MKDGGKGGRKRFAIAVFYGNPSSRTDRRVRARSIVAQTRPRPPTKPTPAPPPTQQHHQQPCHPRPRTVLTRYHTFILSSSRSFSISHMHTHFLNTHAHDHPRLPYTPIECSLSTHTPISLFTRFAFTHKASHHSPVHSHLS